MKKLIIAALAASLSTSALAWGDREQGALAGIAGTLLIQEIIKDNKSNTNGAVTYRYESRPGPAPRYYSDPVEEAYIRGLRAREMNRQFEAEARAYRCGAYGDCQ